MINVAELDERIDRCLAILADNPHSQVFAALAEAYRRRGEFGRAFSVCKSGLKYHPDYAPAHVVLAKLYLYQRMLGDALGALRRAIELDGQTRTTDLLEAEIQIATGDSKAAQAVIDRLRISDPGNPGLAELVEQVKQLGAAKPGQGVLPSSATDSDGEHHPAPEMRNTPDPIGWEEWTSAIGNMRGVEAAFVYDRVDQLVSVHPRSAETEGRAGSVRSLAQVIDDLLCHHAWSPLQEVHIETASSEIWARKNGDLAFGLIGLRLMSFGAIRQRGVDMAKRVNTPPSCGEVTSPSKGMQATHDGGTAPADLPMDV